jgi:hypothetical protein
MGAGRQPSRMKQGNIQGMEEQEQRARAIAEADRARAASRERANSMNPSQPGQDNSSDYFGQDKFDTLLRNLERQKESLNRRKVRGMLM